MNLDRDETQTILQQSVRSFLEQEVPFDRVRSCEREGSWDEALWRSVAEQGWLALPLSAEHGGEGGSFVDCGLLVEEFARRAAVIPIHECLVAARTIQDHAPPALRDPLLAAFLAGDALPVPAIAEADEFVGTNGEFVEKDGEFVEKDSEFVGTDGEFVERNNELVGTNGVEANGAAAHGHDASACEVRDGRLHGRKRFVDYGTIATHFVVAAREGGVLGLHLVEADARGVSRRPLRSIGRTPLASVDFDAARCQRVGGEPALSALTQLGRALASVQCLGALQQSLDLTVAYAKVREQFGKPIGSFQAVRHHCANMATRVAAVRLLTYEALSALDSGRACTDLVDSAKAAVSLAAPEVTMTAHQIHGGNGVIEENDLYFFTLRAKERALAWGSSEECLDRIARNVGEPVEWL